VHFSNSVCENAIPYIVPRLLDIMLRGDLLDTTAERQAKINTALEHYRKPGSARYKCFLAIATKETRVRLSACLAELQHQQWQSSHLQNSMALVAPIVLRCPARPGACLFVVQTLLVTAPPPRLLSSAHCFHRRTGQIKVAFKPCNDERHAVALSTRLAALSDLFETDAVLWGWRNH
jgi:hypothetical protein